MNVLFITSEAAPFAKTGGLGDVSYALPQALAQVPGVQVRLVLPYYRCIRDNPAWQPELEQTFFVPLAWRRLYAGALRVTLGQVEVYFIDNEYYFDRPGLYGDYDDGERFAYFCRAVLELANRWSDWTPDILHCNDWQSGLVPVYQQAFFAYSPLRQARTLLTVHNAGYQGQMPPDFRQEVLGLNPCWDDTLTFDGCINLLKAGLVTADRANTVSPTYASELKTAWYARGLENIFRSLGTRFSGIVNGIDQTQYDPGHDPALHTPFTRSSLGKKAENKSFLQQVLGLPVEKNRPLVAIVSRLVEHKGIDLIQAVLPQILEMGPQLVVLGTGDDRYQTLFCQAQERWPGQVRARIAFDPGLASQIYAGADLFLMPSKTEPCGLAQLIAMRYGAIPLVRETGGLRDTVPAWDPVSDTGFGFTFGDYNAHELLYAMGRAINCYQNRDLWKKLVRRAMAADNSWSKSVRAYQALYQSMTGGKSA